MRKSNQALLVSAAVLLGTVRGAPAQSPPTLTDFWNTNAVWVREANNIGAAFGFHFLSMITNGTEIWAYYIRTYPPDKFATGRARSPDGLNWTDDGIVLDVGAPGTWDARLASFPGIWKDGDTWYLVYEGAGENSTWPGDIGLATSTDGLNFVKYLGNPILQHNPGGWERLNIGTPSLYRENGIWYLFYHGYSGNLSYLENGVATGPSLTNLTKYAGNPIILIAPGTTAWDTGTIGKRSAIIKEGPYYYLAFEGSMRPPFDQAKWSSGMARSTNLFNWTKFPANPVIPQTTGGFGFDGSELLRINHVWYLYVRAPEGTTTRFRLVGQGGTLVGGWNLNETSGLTAVDSSGNGNSGALFNGPVWVAGRVGYGLSLDGINDYVEVGDPASGGLDFDAGQSFSYGAWIKPAVLDGTSRRFIAKRNGNGPANVGYDLGVWSGSQGVLAEIADGTTEKTTAGINIPLNLNQWHHTMVVVDRIAGQMRVYVDGGEKANLSLSGLGSVASATPLNLGRASGDSTRSFSGVLDEVRIYSRALSVAEIQALANPPPVFLPPALSGGQLLLDWTGNGQLERASALTGTWSPVLPAPTPPYATPIAPGENRFFRLQTVP